MELTGLGLAQVLTVLGAFGAGVVVLYLLKLRRRQVEVPFVRLWREILAEKQTTQLLSTLKRILSLLIALAIVALLAWALGDPRWQGASREGRTLVVLVDASASMQATDVDPSRLEVAKREARRLAEGLGPNDRMLVAQMDATTAPLSPLTGERRVLLDAVDRVRPTDVAADLRAGLRFGLDVLRDQPRGELAILSDGVLGTVPDEERRLARSGVRLSWKKIGRRGRNVGITAFSVRRYPLDKSQSEVLVELWNPGTRNESVELTLLGDGQPIDVQRLQLRAGERLQRFFANVSGADATLEARLALADRTRDDLPADDRAFARLPERRRARILAVSAGNLYLQAALLLDEYLDVTEVTPSDYAATIAGGRFDVVIFDNFVPPSPPDAHAIYLYPLPPTGVEGPWEVRGLVPRPFFEQIDRRHPVVRWTALDDVNVAEALEVVLRPGDVRVAGDPRAPLIVAGQRSGKKVIGINFDVRRSDLPLRIAWPLVLLNSIDWFVEEDTQYLSSYRTGETWRVPVPAGVQRATLIAPDGSRRDVPVREGRAIYAGTNAGFYRLRAARQETLFAANLGAAEETAIQPAARLEIAGRAARAITAGTPGVREHLWIYFVLGAIVILAIEWFTYHRRWTV